MGRKSKNSQEINIYFSIAFYATASTNESVLIIGGFTGGSPSYTSTIAEYKDGNWEKVGDLAQARHSHGAITSGSVTMVIGGYPRTKTELWEFYSLENGIIDPILPENYSNVGLFLVDVG